MKCLFAQASNTTVLSDVRPHKRLGTLIRGHRADDSQAVFVARLLKRSQANRRNEAVIIQNHHVMAGRDSSQASVDCGSEAVVLFEMNYFRFVAASPDSSEDNIAILFVAPVINQDQPNAHGGLSQMIDAAIGEPGLADKWNDDGNLIQCDILSFIQKNCLLILVFGFFLRSLCK